MTLIEVVTGLVILGTVLASLAVARGRFARQWADADQRLAATRALDVVIGEWMSAPGQPRVPARGQGPLPDVRNCIWRTELVADAEAARLSATIIRVQAIHQPTVTSPPTILTTVDLLVHVMPRPPATRPVPAPGRPR